MAAISVSRLTKRFGSVTAVDDLSFDVQAGTITGFVGPNGAGKTTTLRMILGLVRPTSGIALVNGVPYIGLHRPARHVGAVLESSGFHPGETARDYLRVLAYPSGVPTSRVDDVLDEVGLTSAARRRVGGFSLGMRQRLGLAGALLGDPGILVLDEPTNGLDPAGVHWLRDFLRQRVDRGGTVLISSHLLAELALSADHVVIIKDGCLIAQGRVDELMVGERAVRVRTPQAEQLCRALTERGVNADLDGPDAVLAQNVDPETVGQAVAQAGLVVYEMNLIKRYMEPLIEEGIDDARIVFVAGARQVGKTTLIRKITRPSGHRPMRELSLDDTATRDAANADPAGFVAGLDGPTFIDEIHRASDLLLELKKAVDDNTVPGRFLITGSANVLASRKILDALPGRIDRLMLWPLAQTEIETGRANFVDALFAGAPPQVTGAPVGLSSYADRIAAGGFPEARERAPGRSRSRWFDSYVAGSLERDLRELADVRRAEDAEHLLRLLASQTANLFKADPIASKVRMDHKTVRSYVGLLRQMHLVHQLPGWRPGLGARESTTPKMYISDVGLLCHLLGADARRLLADDQVKGKACETFVVNEVLKQMSWAAVETRAYHYQRRDEDVDLVLEDRAGDIACVEVKAASTLTARDWRWLAKLRDARGSSFRAGVIIASVAQTTPLGDRLWAVPYSALWL